MSFFLGFVVIVAFIWKGIAQKAKRREDMHQRSLRTGLEPKTTSSRAEASVHGAPAPTTTPCNAPALSFFFAIFPVLGFISASFFFYIDAFNLGFKSMRCIESTNVWALLEDESSVWVNCLVSIGRYSSKKLQNTVNLNVWIFTV